MGMELSRFPNQGLELVPPSNLSQHGIQESLRLGVRNSESEQKPCCEAFPEQGCRSIKSFQL